METVNITGDVLEHYKQVKARLKKQTQDAINNMRRKQREEAELKADIKRKETMARLAHEIELRASMLKIQTPWRTILNEVAKRHMISPKDILSNSRRNFIVVARQEVCWRLHKELKMSLPQIGRRLNRDHTTILHSLRAYELLSGGGK